MQKGAAPILIVVLVATLAGLILLVPFPYYQNTYCNEMDPPGCYPAGWKLKSPLWQEILGIPTQTVSHTLTPPIPIPIPTPQDSSLSAETANWKTYTGTGINSGITFNYPSSTEVDVYKYATQLYVGYTNQEWFNKINSLNINESFSDQREIITKLASGKVESGENYVIFRGEPSGNAQLENFNQLKAYILDDQIIVQIILHADNIEIFNQILSTFKFIQ